MSTDNGDKKALLEKYAEMKDRYAQVTKEIEELQPAILEILTDVNPVDRTVKIEGRGTFSVATRKTYSYPADIAADEEAIKARKKDAVRLGTALVEEKEYLLYRPEGAPESRE